MTRRRHIEFLAWGLLSILALAILLLAGALVLEQVNRAGDARRFPPPGHLVDVGGRRLHIRCLGEGGPTVVLETASGVPSLIDYPLQDRIAAFARVCTYDRAGMGWSDDAGTGRSFPEYAADLHRLLNKAGERGPFVLVGESWGGTLAHVYTLTYQNDVAGLVLVDAADARLEREVWVRRKPVQFEGLLAELGIIRYGVPAQSGNWPGLSAGQRVELGALMSRPSNWRVTFDMTPYLTSPAAGWGKLGATPLVVIRHGRPFSGASAILEPGWAAAQQRLAALSSDTRTVLAADNGHMIAEENPALVAALVRDLVVRLRRPSGKDED